MCVDKGRSIYIYKKKEKHGMAERTKEPRESRWIEFLDWIGLGDGVLGGGCEKFGISQISRSSIVGAMKSRLLFQIFFAVLVCNFVSKYLHSSIFCHFSPIRASKALFVTPYDWYV